MATDFSPLGDDHIAETFAQQISPLLAEAQRAGLSREALAKGLELAAESLRAGGEG